MNDESLARLRGSSLLTGMRSPVEHEYERDRNRACFLRRQFIIKITGMAISPMSAYIRTSAAKWLRSSIALVIKTCLVAAFWTISATAQTVRWSPDLALSPPCTGCTSEYAGLAVHGSGNAIAIWIQDSGVPSIVVAHFDAKAGAWSAAKTLYKGKHVEDGQSLQPPKVVMDKSGNALAVWAENGSNVIYSARYLASDAAWSSPLAIHVGKGAGYGQVILASDPQGDAILQWSENTPGAQVFIKHFNASKETWGTSIPLASATDQQRSDMAVDGNGNAMSIWIRRSDHDVLFSRYKRNVGRWSAPVRIGKATQGSDIQVVLNRAGNGAALWQTNATANAPFGFLAVAYFDNRTNTWTAPRIIQSDTGILGTPEIAIDQAGNVFVVWGQAASYSAPHKAMAVRYDKRTGKWSMPKVLSSGAQHNLFFRLATDLAGNAIAIWSQTTRPIGIGPRYFKKAASLYNARTSAWSAVSLSKDEAIEAFAWDIGFDGNGEATALYQQGIGNRSNGSILYGIRANRLTFAR